MSRSGYADDGDIDQWALIRWRGAVASAVRGKRGQAALTQVLAALDAMPIKELISDRLECPDGVCALGALGASRGIDMSKLDPDDVEAVSAAFDIAGPLVREIVWINDEGGWWNDSPAERFRRVRAWVERQISAQIGGAA